jgi:uroporphyrinogen-III decarboxylase
MNNESLLKERWNRINKAIALEKPDRTPVIILYALFAAKITGQPFNDFCCSIAKSAEAMIKAFEICGDADGMDYVGFPTYGLSFMWLSKIKLPGKDLPDDVSYQVAEAELMKLQDYDTILEKGYMDWYLDYMQTRVIDDVDPSLLPMNQPPYNPFAACDPLGIPVLTAGAPLVPPFDALCGGRSMTKFVHDLFTIPDKVEAVMDLMIPNITPPVIEATKALGGSGIWVGGWRSASSNLSPKLWDRFVWPYYRRMAMEVIDAGLTAILHIDGDWTRDLARFKELPKGKCILAPDGMTDIFKAKEILGDHMCIMGDVPAAKLSMATPDEVYNYSNRLIKELGPEGFILHSGCDIPANAKLENVRAMVSAATGK